MTRSLVAATLVFLLVSLASAQEVTTAASHFVSQPVTALPLQPAIDYRVRPVELSPQRATQPSTFLDAILQTNPGPVIPLTIVRDFDGILGGGTPPDPTGAVGMTQYVQAVNSSFAIFVKATGRRLFGPSRISVLWKGTNDTCAQHDHGDPIVLYDKLAHRWVISQFILRGFNMQCIAVSNGEDAMGTYQLYRFNYPAKNDYPKFGTWPDAYYVSFNMFSGESGGRACAYERDKILVGAPATQTRQVCFRNNFAAGESSRFGQLPADFDGTMPPPAGAPNVFARRRSDGLHIELRRFRVNWANPTLSTFGNGPKHAPDTLLRVSPFADACGGGTCVPQLGTTERLDTLGERLMFRNVYRRFADHEVLLFNHSVKSGSSVGVRWYEVRDPAGTPALAQQGTFAPDATARWMGSIAIDKTGNIALGYSASSSAVHPGIRATARTPATTTGVLGVETSLFAGPASQNDAFRWGDYSQLTVDPSDECTFWFTAEYAGPQRPLRRSRITAFRLAGCQP